MQTSVVSHATTSVNSHHAHKVRVIKRPLSRILPLFITASLLSCASPPRDRILWPPPPKKPIVEFIGAYASEDDFPKTKKERFLMEVFGEPPRVFARPFGIVSDDKGKVYVSDVLGPIDDGRNTIFNF